MKGELMTITPAMIRMSTMAFRLDAAQIERDVLLHGLTDEEIESIVHAVLAAALLGASSGKG